MTEYSINRLIVIILLNFYLEVVIATRDSDLYAQINMFLFILFILQCRFKNKSLKLNNNTYNKMILEIRKICCYKLILEQKDIFLQFESLRATGAIGVKIFVIIWNRRKKLDLSRINPIIIK